MSTSTRHKIPDHVAPEHVFDFDIYEDPLIRRDLHNAYARLHHEAPPVFYTPANGGHWVITRHDDMDNVARDHEHFSPRESQIPRVANPPFMIPLSLDPPEHTLYRNILGPHFSPKAVGAMLSDMRTFAEEVVSSVARKGQCEFVRDVAAPFPVTVFMRLMGLPMSRFDEFRRLAERYFEVYESDDLIAAAQAIYVMLAELIEERSQNRNSANAEDLMSRLLDARINGDPVVRENVISMCFLLFLGGLDTVTNAMSFAIRYLAGDKALQSRLRSEPYAINKFMEEGLRLYGVVNATRLVVKDCDRFGVRFRRGEMVMNALPIAGWDDRKNSDPAKFDIDRSNRSLLTFSIGPHLCLGHVLARAEMRILYAEWMKQVGEFSIPEGYQPAYRAGLVMSLESLPLRWKP